MSLRVDHERRLHLRHAAHVGDRAAGRHDSHVHQDRLYTALQGRRVSGEVVTT